MLRLSPLTCLSLCVIPDGQRWTRAEVYVCRPRREGQILPYRQSLPATHRVPTFGVRFGVRRGTMPFESTPSFSRMYESHRRLTYSAIAPPLPTGFSSLLSIASLDSEKHHHNALRNTRHRVIIHLDHTLFSRRIMPLIRTIGSLSFCSTGSRRHRCTQQKRVGIFTSLSGAG